MSHNLSLDQQRLLDMYIQQYTQTNNHIEHLADMLDEIKYNIINMLLPNRNTYRSYRHSRQNTNNINNINNINRFINQILNERQNNYIYYDYNNPINPNLYNTINRDANNNHLRYRLDNHRSTIPNFSPISRSIRSTRQNSNNLNYENVTRSLNFDIRDLFDDTDDTFNSNVVVRPTEQQIRNASRLVRYRDIQQPLSDSCPIILERFNPDDMVRQIHSCGHIFSYNAFNQWFNSNVRCPVCRYDIRDYNNNNNNINNRENYELINNNQNSSVVLEDVDDNSDEENNISEQTNNYETNNVSNNINTTNNSENENTQLNSISNLNIVRDPNSNEIEHITFDINNNEVRDNLINLVSRRLFQSLTNSERQNDTNRIIQNWLNLEGQNETNNNNNRMMFDASNNILFYESIIMPNNRNTRNQS